MGGAITIREMIARLFGLSDDVFDIQQAVDHVIGPVLLVLFMDDNQLAQMVSVA